MEALAEARAVASSFRQIHKWFRGLAASQILAATMEDLGRRMPKPQVDLAIIAGNMTVRRAERTVTEAKKKTKEKDEKGKNRENKETKDKKQ